MFPLAGALVMCSPGCTGHLLAERWFSAVPTGRSRPYSAVQWMEAVQWIEAVQQRRSEEHTSELQSLRHLVCRLLLEKKKPTHRLVKLEHVQLARTAPLEPVLRSSAVGGVYMLSVSRVAAASATR